MFRSRLTLFRIAGIAIRIDASWIILAVLVTWSLAASLFPAQYRGLSRETYWTMGVIGAIGLFASILFHELSHALMARRRGVKMNGITLFIFGGVAEMESEPEDPRTELLTALAGPAATVVLLVVLWPLAILARTQEWPVLIQATVWYLAVVNLVLLIFNAIPAFPLDGGRVLRAILWSRKGDVRQATKTASSVGSAFGLLLIVLGVIRVVTGDFIGGMWSFLIGSFPRTAATTAYQQTLLRESLRGSTVREFMKTDVVTVPREIPVRELVDDYFYKHHYRMFPVLTNGRLTGCVSTRDVAKLPPEQWNDQTVGAIAQPCMDDATVDADTEAVDALGQMHRTGQSRLLVMAGDELAGILTLKDLLRFLGMKMELEGAKRRGV
jgi:Zn-dependent protease